MAVPVLAMVLAGGRGKRLQPLTDVRAKPAVLFGGRYRIIDFVLSNFVNSGIYRINVLTQFKSDSLNKHLHDGWYLDRMLGHFIDPVPAQMRTGDDWYCGTADAIYQNMNLVDDIEPDYVAVFGGDHVYRMDVMQMVEYHHAKRADVTIAAVPKPIQECSSLGVLQVDRHWRVTDFQEKPERPPSVPGEKGMGLASMGNYIFNTHILRDIIDFAHKNGLGDFGQDIIPRILQDYKVYGYDFRSNQIPGMTEAERAYWRDVGTIDSYYESNMDLKYVSPIFNLYNPEWPIRTSPTQSPPAKFVFDDDGRRGTAVDSLVAEGCIISGSSVRNSVLSPNVFVHSYSSVDDSIVMSGVDIGRNCRIRRAIIDKYVKVPAGEVIGYDLEEDRKKYYVSPGGIVVIAKHTQILSDASNDLSKPV